MPAPAPTPAPTYSLNLSWSIPSTRVSGVALPLSELSGYEIYYVPDGSSAAGTTVAIAGGSVASYRLTNLAPGTYSFAISALDSGGVKSPLSGVVVVTVGP